MVKYDYDTFIDKMRYVIMQTNSLFQNKPVSLPSIDYTINAIKFFDNVFTLYIEGIDIQNESLAYTCYLNAEKEFVNTYRQAYWKESNLHIDKLDFDKVDRLSENVRSFFNCRLYG